MAIGTLLARHGSLVKGVRCDALIAPRAQVLRGSRVGFGVMSADCVPLLVRSKSGWAAIHAGWRGLACGVIANTLQAVEGIQEVAVFAAAGGGRYEVGGEVIEAIGSSAVHTTGHNGKFLLDTAQTALKQLQLVQPTVKAEVAGICTISDERFYSFRRQGQSCGRSLTFIIP
jgi:copper oxidase (laccase) domain-containing protein